MNDLVMKVILAIIQGASEWLPVSSSGHLVLFSNLLGYENSILFDVALHFGTLMAVFVYFGKDIMDILEDWMKGNWKSSNSRLGFLLLISAIPAGVVGYLFRDLFVSAFESLAVVAISFGITSLLLFIASLDFKKNDRKNINLRDAWIIGFAQALAILPGISRAGATISTGLLRGIDSKTAMKFSFLMSIPVIFGASIIEIGSEKLPVDYMLPMLVSFIVGLASIHFLLKIVVNSKKNLRWFALYTLLLAIGLGIYLIGF